MSDSPKKSKTVKAKGSALLRSVRFVALPDALQKALDKEEYKQLKEGESLSLDSALVSKYRQHLEVE